MKGSLERRNLSMLLLQARESVMTMFRPILKQSGLTEQQWRVIRALSEHPAGELEAGQIAKICCILSPSLTGMLERMERDGLIRRSGVATDQRKVMVSLSAQSRALVRRIAPTIDAQYRSLEREIGIERLDEIYRVLDLLLARPNQETPVAAVEADDPPGAVRTPRRGEPASAAKSSAGRAGSRVSRKRTPRAGSE